MSKFCQISGAITNCTDDCIGCAREVYTSLKEKLGDNQYSLAKDKIIDIIGTGEFTLLEEYGFIHHIGTPKWSRQPTYLVLEGGN